MNKQWYAIPIAILLVATLFMNNPKTRINIVWATGSTPDVYGDRVCSFTAMQYNGTDWNWITTGYSYNGLEENFNVATTDAIKYNSGQSFWRVIDNQPLEFYMVTYLNKTLVATEAEAEAYTHVYINITSGAYSLNTLTVNTGTGGSYNGTYWVVENTYLWNVTGHPIAGSAYNIAISYNLYY